MRVVVTRIEPDGAMHRRMVDTAQQGDRRLWEDLAVRAIEVPVPYRPALGIAIYHISVDDYVVMAAEHDLEGPLRDLVTVVLALGYEVLAARSTLTRRSCVWRCRRQLISILALA
jgi:hypothetical protein